MGRATHRDGLPDLSRAPESELQRLALQTRDPDLSAGARAELRTRQTFEMVTAIRSALAVATMGVEDLVTAIAALDIARQTMLDDLAPHLPMLAATAESHRVADRSRDALRKMTPAERDALIRHADATLAPHADLPDLRSASIADLRIYRSHGRTPEFRQLAAVEIDRRARADGAREHRYGSKGGR